MSIPAADILPASLPRDLEILQPGAEIDWQVGMGDTKTGIRNPGKIGYGGNASGHWLLRGSGKKRWLTVGYPGQWKAQEFGVPIDNQWRYEGFPGNGYDRHIIIVEDDGSVWQGIDWKPNPAQFEIWGIKVGPGHFWFADKFEPGELRRGFRSGTAGGFSLPSYSALVDMRPGCIGLLVSDYQKVSAFGESTDGLLSSGPMLGQKMVLPRSSESYKRLTLRGGVAAAFAENLATYGCVPVDRSGYQDITGHQDKIGAIPREAVFWIQTGNQWLNTNIEDVSISLNELRYGVPVGTDPVNPIPNPRIEAIKVGADAFYNLITDNTKTSAEQEAALSYIHMAEGLALSVVQD